MPGGYLLDTNVVSETRRQHADPGVLAFLAATRGARVFVSVLTLGELRKGVAARRGRDEQAADRLADWVDGIEAGYTERVLAIDSAIARLWGELSGRRTLPVVDTLIAATALVHDLTLATRNARDVAATGVRVLDPWGEPPIRG